MRVQPLPFHAKDSFNQGDTNTYAFSSGVPGYVFDGRGRPIPLGSAIFFPSMCKHPPKCSHAPAQEVPFNNTRVENILSPQCSALSPATSVLMPTLSPTIHPPSLPIMGSSPQSGRAA